MRLAEQKALVADFLGRCNHYADQKLADYRDRLASATDSRQALELQDKIGHWTAYRAFNEYALEELAGDGLDDWFSAAERS
jgi:hypothetical protein